MEDIIIGALEDSGFDRVDGVHERYALSSKLLGKGNYGSVVEAYRKEDACHWTRVAVKCLHLQLQDDVQSVQLQSANDLAKEICLSQRAQGAGVTTVYTPWFNSMDGSIYIPMEKMDCTLLHYAKEQRFRFADGVLTCIFAQCLQALQTVHKASIVHRDIKPENFLVRFLKNDPDADMGCISPASHRPLRHRDPMNSMNNNKTPPLNVEVKLTDFGLSSETYDVWTLSSNAGTPLYMPPESFISTKSEVPAARDVWGLACVFYFLLTGGLPFQETSLEELKKKVLHGKKRIKPLRDTRETRLLTKLTLSMFNPSPRQRPTAEGSLRLLLQLRQERVHRESGHGSNAGSSSKSSSLRSSSGGREDMLQRYLRYGCQRQPRNTLTAMYVCRTNYPVPVYDAPNCLHRLDTLRYGTTVLIDTEVGELPYKPPPSLVGSNPSSEVNQLTSTVGGPLTLDENLLPADVASEDSSGSRLLSSRHPSSCYDTPNKLSPTAPRRTVNYDCYLENNQLPWSRVVYPVNGYLQSRTTAGHCLHPFSIRPNDGDPYPCDPLPPAPPTHHHSSTNYNTTTNNNNSNTNYNNSSSSYGGGSCPNNNNNKKNTTTTLPRVQSITTTTTVLTDDGKGNDRTSTEFSPLRGTRSRHHSIDESQQTQTTTDTNNNKDKKNKKEKKTWKERVFRFVGIGGGKKKHPSQK